MPSYTTLTTEWLAQTIASMPKYADATETVVPLSPYDDFARTLLISGLELLLSDQRYTQYLSGTERKNAASLKSDVSQTTFQIAALPLRIKPLLAAAKRGWWIFDIGFSNGLLYEAIICLLGYLQSEQMHYLQKHHEEVTRMMATMTKKTDQRSAEIYQKTIKIKQSLVGVDGQDDIALRTPPNPLPQGVQSTEASPQPTMFQRISGAHP
jgi:hypothetical protein